MLFCCTLLFFSLNSSAGKKIHKQTDNRCVMCILGHSSVQFQFVAAFFLKVLLVFQDIVEFLKLYAFDLIHILILIVVVVCAQCSEK